MLFNACGIPSGCFVSMRRVLLACGCEGDVFFLEAQEHHRSREMGGVAFVGSQNEFAAWMAWEFWDAASAPLLGILLMRIGWPGPLLCKGSMESIRVSVGAISSWGS